MNTRQQQVASKICEQLADYYLEEKDYPNALKYYKQAISSSDAENKVSVCGHENSFSHYNAFADEIT